MQQSDVDGLYRQGAKARRDGASFWSNPFYDATYVDSDLIEWSTMCNAWSHGWLVEDAGRDEAVARVLRADSRRRTLSIWLMAPRLSRRLNRRRSSEG